MKILQTIAIKQQSSGQSVSHNVQHNSDLRSLKEVENEIKLLFREHPFVELFLKPIINQFEYALDQGLTDNSQYVEKLLYYLDDINKILSLDKIGNPQSPGV